MEVGAVKQAFNNEVILLKKKLNQAKVQIIHKLTRKAKQLTEKKAPDPLKEKLKRKAESAVKEVLILKKIKPKDLAEFMVTHRGALKEFLNRPTVDNNKACARLLLHKALEDKYKFIRGRFSNVPIQDLFMSRLERRKMKKEEKEKQKNKKKGKDNKVVNSVGDWNVEDVLDDEKIVVSLGDCDRESRNNDRINDNGSDNDNDSQSEGDISQGNESEHTEEESGSDKNTKDIHKEKSNISESDEQESETEIKEVMTSTKPNSNVNVKAKKQSLNIKMKGELKESNIKPKEIKRKLEKKHKDFNKNKNLNEKLMQRKFKIGSDTPAVGNKIVDPFFKTATGDNYMSVVEPRGPDEVKEEHREGNRKLRRAVIFGHVPKTKPRYNNNRNEPGFNRQNEFERSGNFKSKMDNRQDFSNRKSFSNDFNDRKRFNDNIIDEKPEKLHPSWEAKKKKSGILPFEGKKIVFD